MASADKSVDKAVGFNSPAPDTHERFTAEIARLEQEVSELHSELQRLYADLAAAREKANSLMDSWTAERLEKEVSTRVE